VAAIAAALALLAGCSGTAAEESRQAADASPATSASAAAVLGSSQWRQLPAVITVENHLPITVGLQAGNLARADAPYADGRLVVDWSDVDTNPTMASPNGFLYERVFPGKSIVHTYPLPFDDGEIVATTHPWGFVLTLTDDGGKVLATVPLEQVVAANGFYPKWPYRGWGLEGDADSTGCRNSTSIAYKDLDGTARQGIVEILCTPSIRGSEGGSETWIRLQPEK